MATANRFDLLDIGEAVHNNFSPPCSIRFPVCLAYNERGDKCCTITRWGWPWRNRGWKRWSRWRDVPKSLLWLLERERPPRQPFGGGFAVDMGGSGGNGNEDSGGLGNWGTKTARDVSKDNKEGVPSETEEKEDKGMTLEDNLQPIKEVTPSLASWVNDEDKS
ncbi:hypothetical protein OPV22_013572 [Ensete ventricosum]|uniref:Hyaluronan/mRNA-binding protein domain-containing protein n=1 Tax=Ensete ventricosum TaxID=4639 RepID=A0AAV8R9Z5_ENSVE|nr:hypothetical protein OPV22_013572 [Ensete ventricosum]